PPRTNRGSFRVVKDHAYGVAMARSQSAHSVPEIDAIGSSCAVHGTVVHREYHGIAPAQRYHLGPRLHPWPLLDEHEFAAGELLLWLRQPNCPPQGKDMLATEIVGESGVVPRSVF